MPNNNRLNYVHMNHMIEFKEQLKEHQAAYVAPDPILCSKCSQEVETAPMQAGVCYDCYRESLTHRNVTISTLEKAQAEVINEENEMEEDLGTHVIVSGGEVVELDSPVVNPNEDLPF